MLLLSLYQIKLGRNSKKEDQTEQIENPGIYRQCKLLFFYKNTCTNKHQQENQIRFHKCPHLHIPKKKNKLDDHRDCTKQSQWQTVPYFSKPESFQGLSHKVKDQGKKWNQAFGPYIQSGV